MSTATIPDVLARISTIQQQLQSLQNGSLLAELGSSGFAGQLAQAQQPTGGADIGASALSESSLGTPGSDSLVAAYPGTVTGGAAVGASLPASASSQLTSGQQQFASTLSAQTGLNPGVVTAWLLAEESGGAAQSRQAAGNNDWLNIGYTDSGTFGSGDSIWSDPVSAAQATAAWLKGQDSIPGYGTASAGVQGILASVGQTPADQIRTIQQSGWASGGYPSLAELYAQVTGTNSTAGSQA